MIYTKDHKTMYMFDPFDYLGPKRKNLIEKSWAKIFREHILPELPVNKIFPFYDSEKGRHTKELYSMLGLMILQQMRDLTDEEAVDAYAFNIKWHYALNITGEDDKQTYVSPKTLWTMRSILTENNLYDVLFEKTTDKLAKLFLVNTLKQRIDSVHIFSNMRHLGRIGLFVKTIKKFLKNLKRHHKELFSKLDTELTGRYLTKKGENLFSMVKPSESSRTLQSLAEDIFFLIRLFADNDEITNMSSYNLLSRLLKEQCVIINEDETNEERVTIKPNKEVPSDSLQNPSDPDAGYDGHKGKGYQVQVQETYSRSDEEKKQLSLITHVSVEPANKSDAEALLPAIEDTKKRGIGPEELLSDSLYGGDENIQKAKEEGVEVISPIMGKEPKKEVTLSNFTFLDDGKVESCPQGQAPLKIKYKKGRFTALFKTGSCNGCPLQEQCPCKPGKKGVYLRYTKKDVRSALRRAYESTDEFYDKYRYRAGVEATMSEYDRKTGVKRLRVRGLKAVSYSATLKAIGINLFRASAFKNKQKCRKDTLADTNSGIYVCYLVFKELISAKFADIENILQQFFNFGRITPVES